MHVFQYNNKFKFDTVVFLKSRSLNRKIKLNNKTQIK